MKKSSSTKFFLILLPLFIFILFGMIYYNARFIQKTDKEYSQIIESAGISSNALSLATINAASALQQCTQLVLDENTSAEKELIVQNLNAIRIKNNNLIERLNLEAKNEAQKIKLGKFIAIRAQLMLQRDSLVQLVNANETKEAKAYFFSKMTPNYAQFFLVGAAYLSLIEQNTLDLNHELTHRNNTIVQINEYLFWLPIIALGLFIAFILFTFLRVYSITKDDLDY
ncbi:MAG: MCP four helix bundle domain-containing protein [bacterium]|nr:MCP four helix bundle domain-containing protein [bacterium]